MLFDKRDSLKKTYYRIFFALIVVPIFCIFVVSLRIVNRMIRSTAINGIQGVQSNIISALTDDIREASLQLSHFVYVNDGEMMEMAARSDTDDTAGRYDAMQGLSRVFQTALAPGEGIVSGMFYMRDGRSTYLKDKIVLPDSEIKQAGWYRAALDEPDTVKVGSYDTTVSRMTYSGLRRRELLLVTALSPGRFTDRSGRIEMAALFTSSPAGDMIRDFNRKEKNGFTIIAATDGSVLFGEIGEEQEQIIKASGNPGEGVRDLRLSSKSSGNTSYTCVVSDVPSTGWRLITYVRTSSLTERFGKVAVLVLLVLAGLLALFYVFSNYFLTNIITPVHTVAEGLKKVDEGNLKLHIEPTGQMEIREMLHSFNQMVRRLESSIRESEEERQKKHEAEMQALQSQINPHFLVNSLNSIRFMAQVSKYEGIRRMAEAMINILTCSFRSNLSFYTVKEELAVLDSFIYLMKIRYSNSFDVEYQVDEGCVDFLVPRLILQPVAENSIVHGFEELEDDIGHLVIRVYTSDGYLYFEIKDNGKGINDEQIKKLLEPGKRKKNDNYSIGIENVYTRLKLNFKGDCEMRITSIQGEYTKTVMKLPVVKESAVYE